MRIFWEKNKNRQSVGGSEPRLPPAAPPRCYFRLLLQLCRFRF